MRLTVTIERNGDELWGRVEKKGNFLPLTVGKSLSEVIRRLQSLISDYKKHEGKNDPAWRRIDPAKIEFIVQYDVQSFFFENDFLKQSKIAELAGINPGLLRQYASGLKHPTPKQAKKIEDAIHKLARELQAVSIA